MKIVQVLLSFIFILRWASGEHFSVEGKSRFFNTKTMRKLASYMGWEADPCGNFYDYACGDWAWQHVDVTYDSAFCQPHFEVNDELHKAIDLMNYRNKTGFVKNVKHIYTACRDIGGEFALKDFNAWFEEHEQSAWNGTANDFNWAKLLGMARRYGMNDIFVSESIENDEDDLYIMTIGLDKATHSELNAKLTEEVLKKIHDGFPKDYITEKEWADLDEFEDTLMEMYKEDGESSEESYRMKQLPLKWLKVYFAAMLGATSANPDLEVTVDNLSYMQKLDKFFNEYYDEFIFKYVQIRFIDHLLNFVAEDFDEFDCMQLARNLLPLPANYIYEQQHPEIVEEYPKVFEVFDHIVEHIKQKFQSDESEVVPQSVKDKLDKIELKIGYLPRVETIHVLESLYSDLKTNENDFYDSFMNILVFNFNKTHTVNTRVLASNADQFFDLAPEIGCADSTPYNVQNLIIIPATLLRQPYFHWAYSDFSIYSALGVRMSKAILAALGFDVPTTTQDTVYEVAALHIAFDTFFSNISDEFKEKKIDTVMQKAFMLRSAQYFCDDNNEEDLPKSLNNFITYSSKYSDLFECKYNKAMEIFK